MVEDDERYCEAEPRSHRNRNLKIVKHTADNRLGMTADTIMTTTRMLVIHILLHVKERNEHDNMRSQPRGM